MPYRLLSGSPSMTVTDVADRFWTTIIGCENGHSVSLIASELIERFPPRATLAQLSVRLKCSVCGSRDGEIGFTQGRIQTDRPMQGF